MKTVLSLAFAMLFVTLSFSQSTETDSISKSKISRLEFMTGSWEGTGWMMGRDGTKSEFNQSEEIRFKLDSTMIIVEGVGTSQGKIVHNALAILTYNKKEDNYSFRSYLQNGQSGEFPAELIDKKLYWYPNDNVRYVIWTNEKGQWYETGEFLRGDSWTQFFEMALDKKK